MSKAAGAIQSTPTIKSDDTADPATLIRNALTAQYDHNAAVVLSGPATDLAKLLDMYGAKDLIVRKVGCFAWRTMGRQADAAQPKRCLPSGPRRLLRRDARSAKPCLFPGDSIEKDFAYASAHPVAEAYRAYRPMPYDAPSWAMAAMLYAVHSDDGYFKALR